MRPQAHGIDFPAALILQPGLDHILREHITLGEKLVIVLKGVERPFERARHGGYFAQFRWTQRVDILVQRLAWIKTVLDAIEPSHKHGRKGEVGIAGWIR